MFIGRVNSKIIGRTNALIKPNINTVMINDHVLSNLNPGTIYETSSKESALRDHRKISFILFLSKIQNYYR